MVVIQSFADETTEDLFNGLNSKAARVIAKAIWSVVRRKLDMVNAAHGLNDLKVPPNNKLHALDKDQAGRSAIRVNDRYRITFRFADGNALDVRCENYH